MTYEQVQVISLFHSNLLQKPVKRVVVSERLDLVQTKPAYVPACTIASPEVPHFVRVACNPNAGEDDGAAEHEPGTETGWIDPMAHYVTDEHGAVIQFRRADGSMASPEDLQADARRYAKNFAADTRFCHVYNHSHV